MACDVCGTIEDKMGNQHIFETYSEEALHGAIQHLMNADYLGKWAKDRIEDLEKEVRRRKNNHTKSTK
jgi:hypothetical protein